MPQGPDPAAREEPRATGLLMVHTGDGKGKTTAALGMLVRALGHGFSCAVVQFIKGGQPTAEVILAPIAEASGGALAWDRCGQGFSWRVQDPEADRRLAEEGWGRALEHLRDPGLRFLMLDELNLVLRRGHLDESRVIAALRDRHPGLHVVVTGRGAPEALLEAADLVTEMRAVKHPLRRGIQAQAGIEF